MTYEELIEHLRHNTRVLKHSRLEEAFRAVDRAYFVPKELQDEARPTEQSPPERPCRAGFGRAYEDYPLPIGYGATISQPTTVTFMLEKLDVREGQKVLDIGSGSGWTTALLAHLVGPTGKVIGVEIVPELVALGRVNLRRWHSDVLKNNRTTAARAPEIRQAKQEVTGLPEEAPYDRILVSAAAKEIPKELIEQLKPDGVMVIPVGEEGEVQRLVRVHKRPDGVLEREEYPGFVFVPLR